MLRAPLRCTNKDSWHGHIPFAFWCIDALQPRVLVELGAHKGDSYCAFCQAVEESSVDTRCYAVDTWKGDPYAGFYGDEVYEELRQYHDRRYARFSSLIRSTFDEALSLFEDASVDLLHIDGSHSYEDVRHDFSTWLPKIGPAGVVLFHDIEVRETGFGVWRLWEELRRAYPSFSFPHSLGLGVLAVGASPPGALRCLTTLDDQGTESVRQLFGRLGDAVRLRGAHQTLARQRVRIAELQGSLQEREQRIALFRAERDALHRSTSWRISAPVRVAGRLLQRLRGERGPGKEARREAAASEPRPDAAPGSTRMTALASADAAAPQTHPRTFVHAWLGDQSWKLAFPQVERPEVSIILVTLNKVEYTYGCLKSLLAYADAAYELIMVDNGSTDGTLDLLSRLQNVTVLRNGANRGFGTACNQGAACARGEHLLFLNNDAELAPRSLSALLETARADPRCGAVGGRLVYPDGRLQEAGSILWNDGTANAYGRNGDPNAPEFSYLREVDFCSGALLLVRRDLFHQLGGFDERFAPIYYEDVDLCVGIRGLGLRVLYQPAGTAQHHEYGTTSGRATELMQRNHARFVEKRQAEVSRQHPRSAGSLRARERVARPRLLVVDDRVPTRDAGSGYPRAHALLHLLRRHEYPVTFFPCYDPTPHQPWVHEFQRAGVEVICDGRSFGDFAAERAGFYDVVFVSRPHNFGAVRRDITRWFPRAVVIYDAEALFFVRDENRTTGGTALDDIAHKQRKELELLRFAHLVVTVSEREKRLLQQAAPDFQGQIAVWGHAIEAQPTPQPFSERRDLLFLGSFLAPQSPNEDALSFFVRDVLPLINRRIDCRLQVVGYNAAEAVGHYASDRVEVVGYAEDLTPYYDGCRVFVVPHRRSAGIPWKLSEAMARGVPAVVSDLTALQLGLEDGREALVGRTPEELADHVVRLYTDEALWKEVRTNALEFVRRNHDPEALGRALDDIIAGGLAAGPTDAE
jgi:GT2 family glycosyltransferase/glycosyltransferase involved in cell wall biosynthesis